MSVTHLVRSAARSVVTVVVFIFTLHLLSSAQPLDSSVTCDIPSVEPLANTSVTCHFPVNVGQSERIVVVSFYEEKKRREESNILDCYWLSGNMDCDISSGHKFNRMISNELTLEIPRVSKEDIGQYACKLSSMDPNDIKPCELKIKLVGKTMCDVPPVPLGSRTSLTCYFPVDLSETRASFSVRHHSSCSDPDCAVVSCVWEGDNLNCNTLRGYLFDRTVTSHLTVGIPSAKEEQEGSYSCHFTSSTPVRYDTCNLTLVTVIAVTTFCNISRVTETEAASLTCTFNVDVNETRNNFSLVRLGGSHSKGVDIVTCTWLKDQLKCTTAPGYEFNRIVTDHLVIRVPRASRDHTGTYACHVNGSKATGFQPCDLILKPVTTFCNISSIKETKPASLTCTFNVDVNATKSNFSLVRLDDTETRGVDIVTCTWLDDQLKCTTAPGYEFNNIVTDHLVIRLLRASRDHTGTYACHVTGSSMDGFKPCELILIPDVPAVVLTVAIAVLVSIPVSLVIVFLVFKCKLRGKKVKSEEEKRSSSSPLLSKEEMETRGESKEEFWEKWVEAAFPNLDTDFYFLPPVPVNLQPFRQTDESNQAATSPVQDSDDQDDAAIQRVLLCLERMCKQYKEVLVGMSQFVFDYYLHESCDGDGAGKLPLPPRHQSDLRQKWKQWDIDVLLIQPQFGRHLYDKLF